MIVNYISLEVRYNYKDPLTRKEASDCLYSLVEKVGDELCNLHTKGVAHLDVRLDNICFTSSNEVVLIDFDRCSNSTRHAAGVDVLYVKSEMYTSTNYIRWTCKQLDWKQFGLLILWVLDRYRYHQDLKLSYSPEDSPVERKENSPEECLEQNDLFLYDLLIKGRFLFIYPLTYFVTFVLIGEYNKSNLQSCKSITKNNTKTLSQVLAARQSN